MHDLEECGCQQKINAAHSNVVKWLQKVTDNLALDSLQVFSFSLFGKFLFYWFLCGFLCQVNFFIFLAVVLLLYNIFQG